VPPTRIFSVACSSRRCTGSTVVFASVVFETIGRATVFGSIGASPAAGSPGLSDFGPDSAVPEDFPPCGNEDFEMTVVLSLALGVPVFFESGSCAVESGEPDLAAFLPIARVAASEVAAEPEAAAASADPPAAGVPEADVLEDGVLEDGVPGFGPVPVPGVAGVLAPGVVGAAAPGAAGVPVPGLGGVPVPGFGGGTLPGRGTAPAPIAGRAGFVGIGTTRVAPSSPPVPAVPLTDRLADPPVADAPPPLRPAASPAAL
jgi:hypothetical protein